METTSAWAVGSLGFTALCAFVAVRWPNMPHWVSNAGILIGIVGVVWAVVATRDSRMVPVWIMGCASFLLAVGATWYYFAHRPTAPSAPIAATQGEDRQTDRGGGGNVQAKESVAFETSGNAKLQVIDPYLQGVPKGLLRAGENTESVFKGITYIDPSVPLIWPTPDAKYATATNVRLRRKALSLAKQLRAIAAEKHETTKDHLGLRIAELTVLYEKAEAKADAGFYAIREECLGVGATIAARRSLQVVPREPRNAYLGAEAIILGRLSGSDAILNSAIVLELLAGSLK